MYRQKTLLKDFKIFFNNNFQLIESDFRDSEAIEISD